MKHELSEWQANTILANYTEMTTEQLSAKAKCTILEVKMFCEEKNILPKKKRHRNDYYLSCLKKRKFIIAPEPEKKFVRPAAVYNNLPSPMGIARGMHAIQGL